MAYRLVENKGDSVAVPQLVIAKLPELEDDWLRVALFVVATGETDPARIAAALRLKSPERAQTALVYWKGAGLLESCGEPQARGGIDAAPAPRAHLTTPEVASAAQGDPAIAGLVQECQALMGGVITQADTNILVSMYLSDGMPVDMILLGVAHFAALGKRSARYIERALLGWQREGIDSGEAAERYLRLLDQRAAHEKETAKLLGLADAKFTKADSRAIADWYESRGCRLRGREKKRKICQRHPARMVHQGLQNRARRNGRKRHGLEQRAGRRARRETQYSGRRAAARTACAGHAAGRENTMNRDELYRRAQSIVAGRRQRAVTAARAAAAQAAQTVPGLAALENGRTAAGIEAARLAAMGAERTAVDAALARAAQFDRERDALLAAHPDIAARLVPAYTCPICQDTGRDGGEVCECVHALVRQLRQQQVNASSPLSLCSFETFALEKYPDTLVPELGLTARQHMAQVLEYCKYYAAHFSPRESTSLYLFGSAGLGKTHLALSIANTVLQKGCDVVYVSAQNAFDAIERERFASGEGDTMATLQSAELLILDDLGTEYISPYVNSCLYSLVNTRVCRRLPTIYTSNIVNDADLQRRYTEKVVSRLLGSCETLCFCGTDIRLMDK